MSEAPPYGVGLRAQHYDAWLASPPPVALVEVIIENVLGRGGRPRAVLDRLASRQRLAFHGLSLSLAGPDRLSRELLDGWRALDRDYHPDFIGDHLCFSRVDAHQGHDLWPVPRTEAMLRHVVDRVRAVQDVLGRQITVENVSAYVELDEAQLSPAEFLGRLAVEADCGVLLDVNNLMVEQHNFGHDAREVLAALAPERVAYFHIADYSELTMGPDQVLAFDDHSGPPRPGTRQLWARAVARYVTPPVTVLEWDTQTPHALSEYVEAARLAAAPAPVSV